MTINSDKEARIIHKTKRALKWFPIVGLLSFILILFCSYKAYIIPKAYEVKAELADKTLKYLNTKIPKSKLEKKLKTISIASLDIQKIYIDLIIKQIKLIAACILLFGIFLVTSFSYFYFKQHQLIKIIESKAS